MAVPPPASSPASSPARPALAKPFSEHAEDMMWTLYKDSASQVGSRYGGDRKGKAVTDCITYVRQVLEYAFEQVGNKAASAGVRAHYQKGTTLAQYLVGQGWGAYYWNPDVREPRDGKSEHPFSYKLAKSSASYYNVSLKGYIIDYHLTPAPWSLFRKPKRTPDMVAFDKFSKVRFAYGLARGGDHTFLLSFGMVYEVHWDAIGGDPAKKLYEASSFWAYPWLSGLVVVPPDAGFSL
jgi:hypothetical protein